MRLPHRPHTLPSSVSLCLCAFVCVCQGDGRAAALPGCSTNSCDSPRFPLFRCLFFFSFCDSSPQRSGHCAPLFLHQLESAKHDNYTTERVEIWSERR